jgi:biopolymer transport protein ExbD
MNLYGSGDSRERTDVEVNLTAVMNIFLILVPFLLLTAVFARIAVLEISLPTGSGAGSGSSAPPEKSMLVIIAVRENGNMQIQTTTTQIVFETIYAKPNAEYDYDTLIEQLKRLKLEFPWLEELVMQPSDNVKYDVIIKIMDRCREQGFPNISLA